MTDRIVNELESVGDGARVHLTLLFCDVCDSTAFGELNDPEETDSLRRRIERRVTQLIRKHGGTVTQCYGDGTLAVFGLPDPTEHDTRRALEAAIDIHETIRKLTWEGAAPNDEGLAMHSGVHAGLVFVRTGDTLHGRFELTGDPVNVAARLSSAAARDEILVSEEALRGIDSFFTSDAARQLQLKGKREQLRAHRVTGRSTVTTRFDARERDGLAPLAGRMIELDVLTEALNDARRGQGKLVLVKGPAGIGKTRLLSELRARAISLDVCVVHGSCESYGEIPPLEPFLQCLRQLFHVLPETQPLDAVTNVSERLDEFGLGLHLATFLHLLSLPRTEQSDEPTALSTVTIRAALGDLAIRTTQRRSALLLLDDWQWSDETSRGVLRYLRRHLSRLRICVVVSARDDGEYSTGLKPHEALELQPLSETHCKSIASALGVNDVDVRRMHQLHERSGGNPLFLEELCRAISAGFADNRASYPGTIPHTLHELIQARLSRIGIDALQALQTASVIGLEPQHRILTEVCGVEVESSIVSLQREGLLSANVDGDRLCFKHGIIRDVVYESVRMADRKRLHRCIADAIVSTTPEANLAEHLEALAFHYRGCGELEKAADYSERAADKAEASSFLAAARRLYYAAMELLDLLPVTPQRKQRWLSINMKWSGICAWAPAPADLVAMKRAVQYAGELNSVAAQAHNSHMLGWMHYVLGNYRDAVSNYRDALVLAEQGKNERLSTHITITLSQAHGALGEYREALENYTVGLTLKRTRTASNGRSAGSARAFHYAYALSCRALLYADLGDFDGAEADLHEAKEVVHDSGHAMEASVVHHHGIVHLRRSTFSELAKSASTATALAERVGSSYVYASSIVLENYARCKMRPSASAVAKMRRAIEWLESNGLLLYVSLVYAAVADAALSIGDDGLARDYAGRAIVRGNVGDPHGRISAHRTLATLERRANTGRSQVERHLERAFEYSRALNSPREIAITSLTAAQLGAPSKAHSQSLSLPQALHEFQRMGMHGYAAAAREQLGQLRDAMI